MQFESASSGSTGGADKEEEEQEKFLLFFAPSSSGNVSTVALNVNDATEKEIATKLSSVCAEEQSGSSAILPVDCAPKSSLSSIARSLESKRVEDEMGKRLDAEMAESARRTLERLLSPPRGDFEKDKIEKMN